MSPPEDGRSWTGWKVTLAIIAAVAAGALFLNWLVAAETTPVPTPTGSLG